LFTVPDIIDTRPDLLKLSRNVTWSSLFRHSVGDKMRYQACVVLYTMSYTGGSCTSFLWYNTYAIVTSEMCHYMCRSASRLIFIANLACDFLLSYSQDNKYIENIKQQTWLSFL